MNLADIIENDVSDSTSGFTVSLWFGFCPIHCQNCHNKDLWDYYNYVDNDEVLEKLYKAIPNKVMHNLSILGGEPLCEENRKDCLYIVKNIRQKFPDIHIYLWTGYIKEDIEKIEEVSEIFKYINVLVDGPYIESKRVSGSPLVGSSNQRIHVLNFWE